MAQVNDRIGEYLLEEQIGRGAFGEVWRARHHVWADHLVAVKVPTDFAYVRSLQREGRAIHGLVHPNIVRSLGFDPYAPTPYLIMEYVPGNSLRQLIGEKKLSVSDTVEAMKQVLAGLDHAHKAGVVHGDMKPENVLIHERASTEGMRAQGVVKVTDFGLASAKRQMNPTDGSIVYSTASNDAAKEISGSLEYMAPEQKSGGEIDARTDVYACGVMLYEMLTGERPAGTEVPSELNAASPKHLDDVFRRAYARREKRFASAAEFANAINGALGRLTPPPLPKVMRSGRETVCAHCRKQVESGDQFCIHCGMQLVPHVRRCSKCGAYPELTDKYCLFCGETLDAMMVAKT